MGAYTFHHLSCAYLNFQLPDATVNGNTGLTVANKAFFSGLCTEDAAQAAGFQTLSQASDAIELARVTANMPYAPGTAAWQGWETLSADWANSIPGGGTANVFLNNPSALGIWNTVELPILQENGVILIIH